MRITPSLSLAAFAVLALGCGASTAAPRTAASEAVHRPERIRGVGAEGLAPPSEPHRPERVVIEVPRGVDITPVPEPASIASEDVSDIEVPPPPAAGAYVLPERVEREDEVAVTPTVTPAPRSRRRSFRRGMRMSDPVFDSPSVFMPTGPSSGVPLVQPAR